MSLFAKGELPDNFTVNIEHNSELLLSALNAVKKQQKGCHSSFGGLFYMLW